MIKSAPLKRKTQKKAIESDSESDTSVTQRPKKSVKRSESTRTTTKRGEDSSSDEETGIYCLIEFIGPVEQYNIVSEKAVYFDKNDRSTGKVKHLGKMHDVKILKTGSKDYIDRKAERYQNYLSLNTCDEVETSHSIKTTQALQPSQPKNSSNSSKSKDLSTPILTTIDIQESNIRIEESMPNQASSLAQLSTISIDTFNDFLKKIEERQKLREEDFEQMQKKIDALSNLKEKKSFIYNGQDLLDVEGYPTHVWAANCLKILFSSEETKNCVLVASSYTDRQACCPIKVKLLKDAMTYKYSMTGEKNDKVWRKIVDSFNTKGRGIKHQIKKATNTFLSKVGISSNSRND